MKQTDYKIKEKSLSYSIEGNGYTIYLYGKKWVSQHGNNSIYPDLSYEDACLQHIKNLVYMSEENIYRQEQQPIEQPTQPTTIYDLLNEIKSLKSQIESMGSNNETLQLYSTDLMQGTGWDDYSITGRGKVKIMASADRTKEYITQIKGIRIDGKLVFSETLNLSCNASTATQFDIEFEFSNSFEMKYKSSDAKAFGTILRYIYK